jgi:hypothetical protein
MHAGGPRHEAFPALNTRGLRFSSETDYAGRTRNRIWYPGRSRGIPAAVAGEEHAASTAPRGVVVEYGEALASRRGGGSERRQRRRAGL